MLGCMWQIQWASFHPRLLLIPITSRGGVYNSCIRSARLHASEYWVPSSSDMYCLQSMQWLSYGLSGVQCHHQGPSQLTKTPWEDAAQWSEEGTPQIRWHGHVECSDGWLKKLKKLNPDVIHTCIGLIETHSPERRVWDGTLRSAIRLDPPHKKL